jgi:histidinol phosphatase-like PHP family hydrolase
MKLYDFHTHTFYSDGAFVPAELIRRASVHGYSVIGIADHIGSGGVERVVQEIAEDCAVASEHWDIEAFAGVELTHVPPAAIAELTAKARAAGAAFVAVHGETLVEPVAEGTNLAAVRCPDVDYLCHPGLITPDEARLAAENNVFLEISSRRGHCLTNGHVARVARDTGARLLVGSDAHDMGDLLTPEFAEQVLAGAGLNADEIAVCERNAEQYLKLIRERLAGR